MPILCRMSRFISAFTLAAFAAGCGAVPEVPVLDAGQVAHKARITSERACNAYDLAVAAGLRPDPKADMSCSAVRAVCSETSGE
jgi:hypothetical protein